MSQSEHPEERRARRLAEAKALRGTPEREAQVAEMRARQAAEEAAAVPPARTPRASTSSGGATRARSTATRASKVSTAPPGVFGHPRDEWATMVDTALVLISGAAAEGQLMTPAVLWSELAEGTGKDLGDARFKMPRLLADVAAKVAEDVGILSTAIVVTSEEVGPGRPFFTVAKDLDLIPEGAFIPISDGDWRMPKELREFWRDQVDATFEHYASDQDQ
ncbi:MAG: hypothetical protein ABI239_11345 [Aquihabitans sp.]